MRRKIAYFGTKKIYFYVNYIKVGFSWNNSVGMHIERGDVHKSNYFNFLTFSNISKIH
jgi:hypothetical protein